MNTCRYCRANADEGLEETTKRLAGCHNCRADIVMRGQWSGHGLAVIRSLVDQYGIEAVQTAYDKALTEVDERK